LLVDTNWLNDHLNDPDSKIFDSTTLLKPDPQKGFVAVSGIDAYDSGHIPGAGFLDLQGELSEQGLEAQVHAAL
jgi:thiosulfate/3-mercaptopyruvate sulfurtransferase